MGSELATTRDRRGAPDACRPQRPRAAVDPVAALFLQVQRSAGNGAATALAAGGYGKKEPADEPTAAGELADAVRQLAVDWDALGTPIARGRRLVDAANDRLRELGIPAVEASLGPPPDSSPLQTNDGLFTPKDWTIHLSERFFSAPPDPKTLADLGGTVAHEARHTEQWFTMARYLAGTSRDLTAEAIAAQVGGMPVHVARRARADRLSDGDAGYEQAKAWYESVYGAGAAHR